MFRSVPLHYATSAAQLLACEVVMALIDSSGLPRRGICFMRFGLMHAFVFYRRSSGVAWVLSTISAQFCCLVTPSVAGPISSLGIFLTIL